MTDDWKERCSDLSFVRKILASEELCPVVPELRSFVGGSKSLPLLQCLPVEEHRRSRAVLNRAFNYRSIADWSQTIRAIAAQRLIAMPVDEYVFVRDQYIRPIVLLSSIRFVGLHYQDREIVDQCGVELLKPSQDRTTRKTLSLLRLDRLIRRRLEDAPDQPSPHLPKDLLTRLKKEISDELICSVSIALLTAGVELVTRSIILCLAREIGCKSLPLPSDINNALAVTAIVPNARRVARSSCSIDGRIFSADSHEEVEVGLRVTTQRELLWSLPFGYGPHFCLGAAWTRVVTLRVIEAFRLPWQQWDSGDVEASTSDEVFGGYRDVAVRVRQAEGVP